MLFQTTPPQDFKPLTSIVETIKPPAPEPPKPNPDYIIKDGDTLTSIAEATHSTVERLWQKNTQLSNPDVLAVADPLKVPEDSETLPERAMISTGKLPVRNTTGTAVTGGSSLPRGSSAGNLYAPGNCTFFIASQRPIPNSWGNAVDWYWHAQRDGWATGSEPRVGAIAWARNYGHVALVISVTGNNVRVREENYKGLYIISEREAPISEFLYIY